MNVVDLGTAVQVKDIDLFNDDECKELGKIVAHECVVFVDQDIPEKRLHDLQLQWGDPSMGFIHKAVAKGRLNGRHWRDVKLYIGYIADAVKDLSDTMSRVSFERTEKNRPTGLFTTGTLDWHCDQQSKVDKQRIIGLMSLYGSENTQTTFMRTSEAYEALNHEDKSMVDELTTVWAWDGTLGAMELEDKAEIEAMKYSNIPMDGMETPLTETTATGRKGFRFPNYAFGHFKGMSREDSLKYRKHLWDLVNRPEYVYTQNWKDKQIVFMDQNITLHARPTNVREGMKRTMVRNITYVNHLFEGNDPVDYVMFKGEKVPYETFLDMIDEQKLAEYNNNNNTRSELWLKE
jgi:alpha-ketoglutarate-dependent taurine dioxygenase